MDSDLSLIEISGEDDSLLNGAVPTSDDASSFHCSPLIRIPRPTRFSSSQEKGKGNEDDARKPSSSSSYSASKDGAGKENVNATKPKVIKLSVEPQQMKRKKNGGAYNLRKSLAWNRAFFTEEGVLDPMELSMLNGNLGNSIGLSTIQEGRESLCSGLDSPDDLLSLQAIDDKLFRELPGSIVNVGGKVAGFLSPKLGSSARDKVRPASAAKRKVFPVNDVNKSASKRGGLPQPVASSSLRKPSTGNRTKDSRLSTLFTSKPDLPVASASGSTKILARDLKKSQIPKPATAQKNDGAKISKSNVKTARRDVKSGPTSNSSRKLIQQAKRNAVSSEPHSSSNVQHQLANQTADSEVKAPDPGLPPAAFALHPADVGALKTVNSSSQNVGNMKHRQPQTAKPSGLRMPSPSLGFFGQSKPSGSQNLPQRTQLGNIQHSGVPSLSTLGSSNPIQQRPPLPRKVLAKSSKGSSVASKAKPVLHRKVESNKESNTINNPDAHMPSDSKSMISNQRMCTTADDVMLQSLGHGKPSNSANISPMEDIGSQNNDNKMLLQSGPDKPLNLENDDKGATITGVHQKQKDLTTDQMNLTPHLRLHLEVQVLSETNRMTSSQKVDHIPDDLSTKNQSFSSELQSGSVNYNMDKDASKVPENLLCSMYEVNGKPGEKARMKTDFYKASEELSILNSLNAADDNSAGELGTPHCPSDHKVVDKISDGASGIDYLSKELQVGGANVQSIRAASRVESAKNRLQASFDDIPHSLTDDLSEKVAKKPELPNPRSTMKQASCQGHGSSYNACLSPVKDISLEKFLEKDVTQSVKSVTERSVHSDGLANCSIACPVASFELGSGLDMVDNPHQKHVGNSPTVSVVSEMVVETSIHDDIELWGDGGSMELDCKGDTLHAVTTCQTESADADSNRGHMTGSDSGNAHLTPQFIPFETTSEVNHTSKHGGLVDEQVKYPNRLYDSLPGNGFCHNDSGASMVFSDCNIAMQIMDEQHSEQAKQIHTCSHESELDNQSQGAHDDLVFHEKSSSSDSARTIRANVFLGSATCGRRWGNAHDLSQCVIMEQGDNNAGVGNMIKEKLVEDEQLQSLDGSNGDDCSSSISGNMKYQMVVDVISQNFERRLETQNINPVAEQVSMKNYGILSDNNLSAMNVSSGAPETDASADVTSEIQVPPITENIGLDMDKIAVNQHMDGEVLGFIKVEPLVENMQRSMDCKFENDNECGDQATLLELDLSLQKTEVHIQVAENASASNVFHSSNKTLELLVKSNTISNGSSHKGEDVNLTQSSSLSEEVQIHMLPKSSEHQVHGLDDATCFTKDKDATLEFKKLENGDIKDAGIIKPQPDAVPFSDEWLAAFEAAGEEILTMKSGAVQNSPPDKSLPEPSPWSPVRRKNNQGIGPFDCTKFTNSNVSPSTGNQADGITGRQPSDCRIGDV